MPLQNAHQQLIQQSSKDAASYEELLALIESIQRTSDDRYNYMAENVPGMIYRFRVQHNEHLRFEYVSQRCIDLNGVTPEAVLQNPGILIAQIHPEDRESYRTVARTSTQAGQPFYWEGRAIVRGEIRWRRLEAQPEQEANGDVVWHGIQIDTTHQHRAEESLRKSEARLRLITDNMLDLICLTDANLVIEYASPSHTTILGYTPESLVGKLVSELVHMDDLKDLGEKVRQSIAAGYLGKAVFRYCHQDGHYLWLETTGSLLYDADGQFMGVVFSSRDITERHQMEQALLESERLKTMLQTVEALNQFKSRMMLYISHEFRTPLAMIQLASESINRYATRMIPEKREELAYRISAQIQHLVNMLDEISFIVHHQSQPVTPKRTTFEINQLCLEMINRIRTAMNSECPIEFVATECYTVTADLKLMQTLLTSLLSNAVKFSPQASSVLLNLREVDGELDLRVIDQGIGISAKDQQHIFEAFYRGSNISEISGMGLGLSIAQEIVKAHGGSIHVESTLNGGTIFTIRLPILAVTE